MARTMRRKDSKRGLMSVPKKNVQAKRKVKPIARSKGQLMLKTKTFIGGNKRIAKPVVRKAKKKAAPKPVSCKAQIARFNKAIKEFQMKKKTIDNMIKRYKAKRSGGSDLMKLVNGYHKDINKANSTMKKWFSGKEAPQMMSFVKTKKFMNHKKKISEWQTKAKNCSARLQTWRKNQFKLYAHILRNIDKFGTKYDRLCNQFNILSKKVAKHGVDVPTFCKSQKGFYQCQAWEASFQLPF